MPLFVLFLPNRRSDLGEMNCKQGKKERLEVRLG
jgi:hypothetical protein